MKAWKENAVLDQENIGSKNHKNLHFFKGVSPWLLSKNGDFLIFRFYPKRDQQIMFCEGFEGNKAFLDEKNMGSKNHKNLHFFKGASPWLLSKNRDFLIFRFYPKRDQQIMFCGGFERKVAFLDQKNISSKNHKKLAFPFQSG